MIQMLRLRPFCDFTVRDTKKLKIFIDVEHATFYPKVRIHFAI